MQLRIALAIKELAHRRRIARLLRREDAVLQTLTGRALGWDGVLRAAADLIIVSRSLIPAPEERSLREAQDLPNAPAVAVLSAGEDADEVTRFRAAGAEAVLYPDAVDEVLHEALTAVIESRRAFLLRSLLARRAVARPRLSDFVSASPAMIAFMRTVRQVVDSDCTLLILGETGVGKERLARAIHGDGARAQGPFISVNCAAVPETLIESELFGHEEGAFTGATRARRGAFELAHRGTIFLDEIGEMPLHLQTKLLHVLQDYEIRPVGAEYTVPVDVRVMAATNRELRQDVELQRFRKDLYYRLGVITLRVPPLRERTEDIPALAESFVEEIASRISRENKSLTADAVAALARYEWPGNVRELINVIERAILLTDGSCISCRDLPPELTQERSPAPAGAADAALPVGVPTEWLDQPLKAYRDAVIAEAERNYLIGLLRQTQGRIAETARRAGLQSRSLHGKMKRYGLRKEDYKPVYR